MALSCPGEMTDRSASHQAEARAGLGAAAPLDSARLLGQLGPAGWSRKGRLELSGLGTLRTKLSLGALALGLRWGHWALGGLCAQLWGGWQPCSDVPKGL